MYTSLVQPHVAYGDMVYNSASGTNKTRLQKLQTRTVRLITGSDPPTSIVSMFEELGCLSLQHRRGFHKCIMIYKCRNGLALKYLSDLFNSVNSMHSYNTQRFSQLWATKSHNPYYHHSFTVSGLNRWNSVPRNIQQSTSLSSFKSALFKFIGAKPQF